MTPAAQHPGYIDDGCFVTPSGSQFVPDGGIESDVLTESKTAYPVRIVSSLSEWLDWKERPGRWEE